jgi:hypothetical protein
MQEKLENKYGNKIKTFSAGPGWMMRSDSDHHQMGNILYLSLSRNTWKKLADANIIQELTVALFSFF